MATRSRRSAATAPVVEEEEEEELQEGTHKLRFKQTLISKPGKQIGVTELLSRLKALCDELREIPQEDADTDSLTASAKELAHHGLIQHKDAGVRAWTACGLVEMFRLFAPNAPYSGSQLKDIFSLIIFKILPLLADPSHSYNSQHMYVLKSLAEFKSIVIVTDIPGSQQLTNALFTTCFDVLSGPSRAKSGEELSKNVEHHMTQLLSILIDESPVISSDIVDVIVAQFLWADPVILGSSTKGKKNAAVDAKQSTLRPKEAPPAYNMAKNICNAFPEKMARLFGTYFGSIIVDFASGPKIRTYGADDEDDEEAKGPSEDDLNDASKAHRLLRELWRCAPGALQEIIPHLQEELGTENVQLRQLATETFGDMISGIGAAGPPPPPNLDPAAYPSQSLDPSSSTRAYSYLTTPASLNSFPLHYPAAYHAFLSRQIDRSPVIRASLTTGIARIIMTSAGGVGLDPDEERNLLNMFAKSLIDSDDRVRLAALKAVELYDFNDIINKLGSNGSMSEPGSILWNLAERIKDKKAAIHTAAIKLLGKIWGVAEGAIAEGHGRVKELLGPIPSRILEACYVQDVGITAQVDITLYESLLPLNYPPMKPKAPVNGSSQIVRDSQAGEQQGYTEAELDKIRAERQLVLVNGLEEKAKKVFFANQGNQVAHANYMEHFLKLCEEYNGGIMEGREQEIKKRLDGLIAYYGKTLPDSSRANEDIWKFVKAHDRRNYQLIRFCMAADSDYRKIFKSIKEFRKRVDENPPSATFMETFTPLLYRVSLLCFNKSHVPAIIAHTRTDEKGLGATAHEVLKEISTKHPKVFSTHVKDLCKTLESEAPTEKSPNPPAAVDDLKACASFAKKFPKEVPLNAKEGRKLVQALLNFAYYGSPPKAAKHAITIIMSCDNKKDVHAREILKRSVKNFDYGCDHWLTKLAALSQLLLLAQEECEDHIDELLTIAIEKVLMKEHPQSEEAEQEWMDTPDDDIVARTWALKIIVNRLLSTTNEETLKESGAPIFTLLNRMVRDGGQASKKHHAPLAHANRQRLLAANFLLKLACQRRLDGQITPADFNELVLVTHDKNIHVRKGFAMKLMKYLGQNKLPTRYFAILFVFALETDAGLKEIITTWLRSRRAAFASRKETVLETGVFARLLSLIAHHPDFAHNEDVNEALTMASMIILFYLKCVATEDSLALIYHMAGRVKTVKDAIDPTGQTDDKLYMLSDLAQALILSWEDQNGWSMQSYPGKQKLPGGIFKPLESHDRGIEIAQKQYVDKDFLDGLEPLVRRAIRNKKRKAGDGSSEKPKKKAKSEKSAKDRPIKTPKAKRKGGDGYGDDDEAGGAERSSGPRRKSDRRSGVNKSYIEVSSDEDEADVEEDNEDEEMTGAESSSPPAEEQDVDMEEAETSPSPTIYSDIEVNVPEPEPAPTKRPARGRVAAAAKTTTTTKKKATNGVSSPAVQQPSPAQRRRGRAAAAEPEPEPEVESEAEPKSEPVKKTRRPAEPATTPAKATRSASKPGRSSVTKPPPSAAKSKANTKQKVTAEKETAPSSSPIVSNGNVRRSGRTRG